MDPTAALGIGLRLGDGRETFDLEEAITRRRFSGRARATLFLDEVEIASEEPPFSDEDEDKKHTTY